MRRRTAWRATARAIALASALAAFAVAAGATARPASAPRAALTASAVLDAASAVRADPDFGGPRTEKRWRLKKSDSAGAEALPTWLVRLAAWMAEGGRLVAWIVAAIAIVALVVGARTWLRVRGDARDASTRRLPTHVGALDIRPESLPENVGAEALALWQRSELRAAVSLLYRGALSRLVHVHGVAIESASTEAECVTKARQALPSERGTFVARLIGIWQSTSWAGRPPDTETFSAFCRDLDRMLPPNRLHAGSPAD